jgi:hypothetical protein
MDVAIHDAGIQQEISDMVKKANKELRKHFPCPKILRALSFTDPHYYCSEEASLSDLQSKFAVLAEHYSPIEGAGFNLNGEKLKEQAEWLFGVASALARNIVNNTEAADADVEAVLNDKLAEYQGLQQAHDAAERHPAVRMWRGIVALEVANQRKAIVDIATLPFLRVHPIPQS